jgi:hypothetical protein
MTKKALITIIIVAVVAIGLYVAYAQGYLGKKFLISGSISECSSNNKIVFQYVPMGQKVKPQHFTEAGDPITCEFNGDYPSENCAELLQSLRACTMIYRSPTGNPRIETIYKSSAAYVVRLLKDTIQ